MGRILRHLHAQKANDGRDRTVPADDGAGALRIRLELAMARQCRRYREPPGMWPLALSRGRRAHER